MDILCGKKKKPEEDRVISSLAPVTGDWMAGLYGERLELVSGIMELRKGL